jgi:glycosyltransferase involved in cell wall biosynthesis
VRPDVQFVVVGQDTREQAPQDLIAALGIGDRLHLLGLRQDVPDVLAAFDVFVLSSHDEGMSNAIMEAMSVGKPVVATDVGGGSEMVSRGVTGLLVPPKVVAPLAEAILQILNTPELGAQMGRHARRVVDERFAVEVMVHRTEEVYETLWSAKVGHTQRRAAAQVAAQ